MDQPKVYLGNGAGVIQGVVLTDKESENGVSHRFAGIPYAQPPIGPRTWKSELTLP